MKRIALITIYNMKKILALLVLIVSLTAHAQYTPQEIKKYKISKFTTLSVTKGDETVQKTETWYDEYGNDTAEYNSGEIYNRTKYEYNSKGQATSRTRFGADGKETETAVYTYKPDGSSTISNTDKSFGMTDLTYRDKTGKTTKTVSPDRSERIYTYDTKGRLSKIKSKPAENGGVLVDQQYTYNAAGQLVKVVSKGDYKWTRTYTYGPKGLLSKSKINSVTDGVADPEVTYTYEYEFRK
jgi:YD repeat-containing protein